jgi:hypothetical protein
MNRFLALMAFVATGSLTAGAVQLLPAGSKLECMVSEKVSSKTMQVGDPVLCELNHSEVYGRSTVPYGAYVSGRFEEYKDPGHFVGKGWMELKFDKLIVGNDTVIPIATRVISTSQKNLVDKEGRIDGTGHAVRDTVEWMIPVLWPIDLINLPRRGPTPTLKPETRLTVLLMEDVGIPTKNEVQHQPEPISKYNYADNQDPQTGAPIERSYPQQQVQPTYAPQAYAQPVYTQPSPTVVVVQQPAPVVIQQQPAPVVMRPPVVYGYPPPPGYYYPGYYRAH